MKFVLSRLLVVCILVVGGHSNLDGMLSGGEEVEISCESMECAPSHLCTGDRKIIKDGDGLIDPRVAAMDCSINEVICCHDEVSPITPDAHSHTTAEAHSHTTTEASSARCYYISTILLGGAIALSTGMDLIA